MQLILRATRRTHHGPSRLVIDCDPSPVKTRRAPSRLRTDVRSLVSYGYGVQKYEHTHPGTRLSSTSFSSIGLFSFMQLVYFHQAFMRKNQYDGE